MLPAAVGSLLIVPEQHHQLLLVGHHWFHRCATVHVSLQNLLLLACVDLVLVPLHIFGHTRQFCRGGLGGRAARLEGGRRRLVGRDRRVNILVHEGSNKWLEVESVHLTYVIEVVLDVSHQRPLLGVDLVQVLAHPVSCGRRVIRIFLECPTGHRARSALLELLADQCLDRRGRILRRLTASILGLLDGLADHSDGR